MNIILYKSKSSMNTVDKGRALMLPTTEQTMGIWIGIGCEAMGAICATISIMEYIKGVKKK